MGSALAPLLQSVSDSIEAIIFTLHQEDFSGSEPFDSFSEKANQVSKVLSEL